MKYGIIAVAGLAVLGGIGAWFYTREDEVAETVKPEAEEAVETPAEETNV